jgi:acyl carrier protein phosphodiesterase
MNYLAHLYLSGNEHGVILGSLLEDYISGGIENNINGKLPVSVKKGLRLHRYIDSFTDTDEVVKEVKQIFYPDFGKYSSVVVDVMFDHFLHLNWDKFSKEPFDVFKNRIYFSLSTQYLELQPPKLKDLVNSMLEHDWLKNYIHFWGLERSLYSLNKRVAGVDLTQSVNLMKLHYDFINEKFLDFFSRLKLSCQSEFKVVV